MRALITNEATSDQACRSGGDHARHRPNGLCLNSASVSADLAGVTILRRPSAGADTVDVASRLAGYEVTSTQGLDGAYAAGYSRAALERPRGGMQIEAPSDVLTDRRLAPRYALRIPVRITQHADGPWEDGVTVDASLTGLCIEMGSRPALGYLDVELQAHTTLAAWARIVAWTPLDGDRFRWRIRLVSYDAGYPDLLHGLEPLVTGVAPAPVEEASAPRHDDDLVGAAAGWGPLLDRSPSSTWGRHRGDAR